MLPVGRKISTRQCWEEFDASIVITKYRNATQLSKVQFHILSESLETKPEVLWIQTQTLFYMC